MSQECVHLHSLRSIKKVSHAVYCDSENLNSEVKKNQFHGNKGIVILGQAVL